MALSSSKTSAKVALLNLLRDKNVYQNRKSLSTDDCAKVDEAILKLDAEMSIKIPTSNRSLNGVWDLRYIQAFWLAGPLKMLNDQIGIQIEQPRADIRTRIGLFGIRGPVIEMKATLDANARVPCDSVAWYPVESSCSAFTCRGSLGFHNLNNTDRKASFAVAWRVGMQICIFEM